MSLFSEERERVVDNYVRQGFYCFVKHHDQKQLGREGLHIPVHSPLRKTRKGLKTGTETKTMKECFIPRTPCGFLLSILKAHNHHPGVALPTCELSPDTSILTQENTHRDLPTGQFNGGIFLIKIPCSQICLGSCQVDKTQPSQ